MRPFFALILCLLLSCLAIAQEENLTPYEIALQRIEEAHVNNDEYLGLTDLGLLELPPEIGNLENLRFLELSRNRLQSLPVEIGNLGRLEELWLAQNEIKTLPAEIAGLRNLRVLDLQENQLTELHSEIGTLPWLEWLDLSENQLSNLPSEIHNLRVLCSLDISNNQFQELPIELTALQALGVAGTCDGLGSLDISGNPLVSPLPDELLTPYTTTLEVLDYLRNPLLWHIRRMFFNWAAGTGVVVALFIALSWRFNRSKSKKKNASSVP